MKNFTLTVLLLGVLCPVFAVPVINSFSPVSASQGMTVTIKGINFTTATAVSFGGTPATSFTISSDTVIRAIVPLGTSGQISVTNSAGTATRSGFIYIATSGVITDFNGWWPASGATPNPTNPDDSHNLLAYTYNGITYSTGVNNTALTSHGISFTPGSYKALPVAGIAGTSGAIGSSSTYLALARKVDGSASVANATAVSAFSVKQALGDGPNGLNLGTGVTNLPASAVMTFQVYNINLSSVSDAEPDILLTQIAQPVVGNDLYSFIDASGVVIGNTISVDMTQLPNLGTYTLDLFHLSPSTPYNTATAYSAFSTNTTREIRLTGLRLSEFGITPANVGQVRALRITPSGNSDYAFIAYNTNSLNLPPNLNQDLAITNSTICAGGTANFGVVAAGAMGGALTYSWEVSINGGSTWLPLIDGVGVTGATTNRLSVLNPLNNFRYRCTVAESGNPATATGGVFTVTINAPTAPTSVSISGTGSTCLNTPVQLSGTVTGGSNLFYQWRSDASGSFADIPGANLQNYIPPVNQTGSVNYRLVVTSGSGCGGALTSSSLPVAVTGVSTVTPAERCGAGTVQLTGAATSGTIDWYAADAGGSSLFSGNIFTTPTLTESKTYYISASGCNTALRVPVIATVNPETVGGQVNGGGIVNPGNNSTQLSLSGYTGTILNWQASIDGFATNIVNIPNVTNQLQILNLLPTTSYRAVIRSGNCANAFSGIATIFTSGTLPVLIGSLNGKVVNTAIKIEWKGYSEENTQQYQLQKSTDGLNFVTIYEVQPYNASETNTYVFTDVNPVKGHNYYRIRDILNDGHSVFTPTIDVVYDLNESAISIFPNPLNGRNAMLRFTGGNGGLCNWKLISITGQVIQQEDFTHPGGSFLKPVQILSSVSPGRYLVQVSQGEFKSILSLIIQ